MPQYLRQRPTRSFWIVSALITLWGAIGVFAFYSDVSMDSDTIAQLPEYDRQLRANMPGWFHWVYGLATWGGLLGGIALLLRKEIAVIAFALSLIAIVVQFVWVFAATDLIAVKGAVGTVPFPLFILIVAIFQLWFARYAIRRGWIG